MGKSMGKWRNAHVHLHKGFVWYVAFFFPWMLPLPSSSTASIKRTLRITFYTKKTSQIIWSHFKQSKLKFWLSPFTSHENSTIYIWDPKHHFHVNFSIFKTCFNIWLYIKIQKFRNTSTSTQNMLYNNNNTNFKKHSFH